MDYFLARYYSGPMGRFLSVDPNNAAAKLATPQTWNGYAYVRNNPHAFVDPDGRDELFFAERAVIETQVERGKLSPETLRAFDESNAVLAATVVAVASLAVPGPEDIALAAAAAHLARAGKIGKFFAKLLGKADDAPRRGGTEPNRIGDEGERLAGIDPKQPKERIPSRTETANFRVLDKSTTTSILKVKNTKRLSFSGRIKDQLTDIALQAKEDGRSLILVVRQNTKISEKSRKAIEELGFEIVPDLPAR